MSADTGAVRPRAQLFEAVERALHLGRVPHDADEILHHVLERVLDLIGTLSARAARERLERALRGFVDLPGVDRAGGLRLRELRGVFTRALAEHEQIRQRIAAQPVRPVDARRTFAGGEQSRHGRHLRVGVDAHAAHDVVRRRTDLHGFFRDVDIGQLLELVIHARQLFPDVLGGVRQARFDPRDVQIDAAVRAAPARLDLVHDAAADVVAREQLRRPPRGFVPLRVPPALLLVVRRLRSVILGNVVEHEAAALIVLEHTAFAADSFGDQDAAHAWRPHHPGWMELDEFHVHEVGARVVREGVAVAGVLPAVAGDLERAADAAGREHHGTGAKHFEAAALALVPECADDTLAVLEQTDDGALHVHVDALMDPVILQRADHLETGAIADVREPRIPVPAEIALQDAPVLRPIEHRAPGLELTHAIGRLLRVQFRHAPVVHVLAAAHRVGEMHLPVVAIVDVRERRCDAAFGHHGVGLAQERLADQTDGHARGRRLDGRPQAGAAGADDEHVVVVCLVFGHHQILTSDHTPIEQSRT